MTISSLPAHCAGGTPGDPLDPVVCNVGTLVSGGASGPIVIGVIVDSDTLGDLINDATASSDTVDLDTSNNLASATTNVDAEADLTIAKIDQQDPVIAGEVLDYQLEVVNLGPSDARNVVVTDHLPPDVTFMTATIQDGSGTCVLADPPTNRVECHIGQIPPNAGTPVFIDLKTRVDPATPIGPIQNQAELDSTDTPDPFLGNNVANETTQVATEADLAVEKVSNQDTYKPSSQVIYTITVTNNGSSDAQNVVVTDTLPLVKVKFLFDTVGCAGPNNAGELTCALGTLAAGASTSFNVHVALKGNPGEITNTAEVASDTNDPNGANDVAVRLNLVKGGTKEGASPSDGSSTTTAEADKARFILLGAEAVCSEPTPGGMEVTLRWDLEDSSLWDVKKTIAISEVAGDFSPLPGSVRVSVPRKTGEHTVKLRLAPGTVHHWVVAARKRDRPGRWYVSEPGQFRAPGCMAYDLAEE